MLLYPKCYFNPNQVLKSSLILAKWLSHALQVIIISDPHVSPNAWPTVALLNRSQQPCEVGSVVIPIDTRGNEGTKDERTCPS